MRGERRDGHVRVEKVERSGEEQQGAPVGPSGAAIRLPPRLTVQMIPGWVLYGRKKKRNARMKPDPGMQLVHRNEFKAYQSKLVRRRNT